MNAPNQLQGQNIGYPVTPQMQNQPQMQNIPQTINWAACYLKESISSRNLTVISSFK